MAAESPLHTMLANGKGVSRMHLAVELVQILLEAASLVVAVLGYRRGNLP